MQQSAGTLLLSHDPNGGKKRTPATQTGQRAATSIVDIKLIANGPSASYERQRLVNLMSLGTGANFDFQ